MDFIEQFFGISPDGGDGSLEGVIIGAVVLIVALVAWRWHSRKSLGPPAH